jgi:hypothetical protein
MPNPPQGMHLCPTRTNDEPVLIAAMITLATCQQRQREHFHKCPTCVHNNARNGATPGVHNGVTKPVALFQPVVAAKPVVAKPAVAKPAAATRPVAVAKPAPAPKPAVV